MLKNMDKKTNYRQQICNVNIIKPTYNYSSRNISESSDYELESSLSSLSDCD